MGVPGFQGNDGVPVSSARSSPNQANSKLFLIGKFSVLLIFSRALCHYRATLVRTAAGDSQEWTVVMGL